MNALRTAEYFLAAPVQSRPRRFFLPAVSGAKRVPRRDQIETSRADARERARQLDQLSLASVKRRLEASAASSGFASETAVRDVRFVFPGERLSTCLQTASVPDDSAASELLVI